MTTNDEIEKLAREYADEQLESLKVYLSEQPEALKVANYISSQTTASSYVNFLNWLLRTHCIVSKEKAREFHTAELDKATIYARIANSCCNNMCLSAYEGRRDTALSRARLLESLFDAETFKNSEI